MSGANRFRVWSAPWKSRLDVPIRLRRAARPSKARCWRVSTTRRLCEPQQGGRMPTVTNPFPPDIDSPRARPRRPQSRLLPPSRSDVRPPPRRAHDANARLNPAAIAAGNIGDDSMKSVPYGILAILLTCGPATAAEETFASIGFKEACERAE